MKIDYDERQSINISHAEFPCPGDYWDEMFSGQYMIVVVTPSLVALCEEKIPAGLDHWLFDLSKITVMTREQFSDRVRYSSTSMNHKTWCDVHPRALAQDVEQAMPAAIAALKAYKRVAKPTWVERLVDHIRAALKARLLAWGNAL